MSNQAIQIWNTIKASGVNVILFVIGWISYNSGIRFTGLVAIWAAIIITTIYGLLGAIGILKNNGIIIFEPLRIDFNKKKQ